MDVSYLPTIGLEIHAELKTVTKMFCNSANDPDEQQPNVNVCPVCLGHPGTLPVINKEAVRQVLRVGLAIGGNTADFTEFDRKNYFYPDIPKSYQISQYKHPLVQGGVLAGIAITRVHLEEDTASSTHGHDGYSLVDFNRAGVPLMELVTEPVIHSAEEAVRFARELQLLLQYLGASDANLEKGEMRIEANISVSADDTLGLRVEVKNLNSFSAAMKAITYEIERQTAVLASGELVPQETRGWDEMKGVTFSQRKKEDSHDYRYFPDPDLPKLYIHQIPEFENSLLLRSLPELPWQKRDRYTNVFGLKAEDAEMFVRNDSLATFFERVVSFLPEQEGAFQMASNYITSDLIGMVRDDADNLGIERVNLTEKMPAEHFAELIKMILSGGLSSRGAKDVLAHMYQEGGTPLAIATKNGLLQESDETKIRDMVLEVLAANDQAVVEYKEGKASALQFLIGQGMKLSRGSANPELLREIFKKELLS